MILLVLATLQLSLGIAPFAVDLVVTNGKIWTGDPARPQATAMAIDGGKIIRVGSNKDMEAFVGKRVVDLGGKRVVPGFCDSHLHVLGGGLQLARVELKDCLGEAEFGKRLKAFDEATPRDRWMLGGNWDHDRTFAGKLPTAETLDKYAPNRPVFLRRYDGHMAVANGAALKLAGITAETRDPPGGIIGRLPDGKTPSGILRDNAMDLVGRFIPEPSEAEIREAVRAAQAAFARAGITAVQDMDGNAPETRKLYLRAIQQLAEKGRLTVRIDLRWPIARQNELTALGVTAGFGSEFVRIGGVKGFMDGSLGSSTAKMFDGYTGDPKTTGVWVTEPDAMNRLVASADRAGLNVAIHAIGDRANSDLLDIFAGVAKANGPRDRRFRIEHAQHLRPADVKRFAELNVIASMQPYHVVDDGRWAEGRIGAERCASSYCYRSLLDAKTKLAFGSDWPVAPLNVFEGIDAAVNRRPLDGKHPKGWYPGERIGVAEAVAAYTSGGAYAAGAEGARGVLKESMLADFAVLSKDIFDPAETENLTKATVELTVVGGKVVWEKK